MTRDLPLSAAQQLVWLHEELFPDSRAYNFTATIDLTGELDIAALTAGMADLIARHPGLRLQLVPGTFPATQQVSANCAPDVRHADLSGHPDPDAEFDRLRLAHHRESFPLDRAPLVRWTVVRLADRHHRLLHTEHHLIHDGHSFAIVLRDLFTFYRSRVHGTTVSLPPAPSYADHARQTGRSSQQLERAARHFAAALDGVDLQPPFAPTAERESLDGGQLRTHIPAPLADALRVRSRADGHTPFTVLLALFAELVRRESGQDSFVVGTAAGARPRGFEECVGMFVNTVPVPLRLRPDRPAGDLADTVTDTLFAGLAHQDVPIAQLTTELGLHSVGGLDNPLFSLLFSAHDAPLPTIELGGLGVRIEESFASGTSRFALDAVLLPDDRRTVTPRDRPAGMTLIWDHRLDPIDPRRMRELAGSHLGLLGRYLDDPAKRLRSL